MEKVVIINNASMGNGSQELGARLINVFLHKVMLTPTKPDVIILYNSGVNLAASGTATAEALDAMTADGVQVLACGTCVEFYQLEGKIKGARLSNMDEITSILFQAKTVITL
jgi:intracellular sulfur oxidation DsrE/DsrF family protein